MEKIFYHLSITSFYGLIEVSVLITNATLFSKGTQIIRKIWITLWKPEKQFLTRKFIKTQTRFVKNRFISCKVLLLYQNLWKCLRRSVFLHQKVPNISHIGSCHGWECFFERYKVIGFMGVSAWFFLLKMQFNLLLLFIPFWSWNPMSSKALLS